MSSTVKKAEHIITNAVNNLTVSTGSDVFSDNSPEESPSSNAAAGQHQRQDSEISVPQFHEEYSPKHRSNEAGNEAEETAPTSAAVSPSSDPSMVLSRQNVALAKADTSGRVYRIYCDGVFDLFHIGHMRMLEQAKKSLGGDTSKVYLICGVNSDEQVHKYKVSSSVSIADPDTLNAHTDTTHSCCYCVTGSHSAVARGALRLSTPLQAC